MKFTKRTCYILIAFLIMLNIVFRYPTTPHETGADSFFIHSLANSITNNGYAKWILHPLSFFGLYPISYASAVPFTLSGMSQTLGVETEISILIFSIIIGVLGTFGAYLLAGEIIDDDRFKVIVAFAFSLSPLILKFTMWTASTRGLFIALLPLFLWCILKSLNKHHKWKYIGLSIFLFVLLGATHRMIWFVAVPTVFFATALLIYKTGVAKSYFSTYISDILLAAVIVTISAIFFIVACHLILPADPTFQTVISILAGNKYFMYILLIFVGILLVLLQSYRKTHTLRKFGGVCLIILFTTVFLMQFTDLAVLTDFSAILAIDVPFVEETDVIYYAPETQMLYSLIMLGARYGVLIFFMVFGIVLFSFKGKKIGDNCILLTTLFFIGSMAFIHYSYEFLMIFLSIIGGYCIFWLAENWKNVKRNAFSVFAAILLISLIFSAYTIDYRYNNIMPGTEDRNYMVDPTYQTGIFLRSYANGTLYGSSSEALRVAASSSLPYPGNSIYEFIDGEKIVVLGRQFSIEGLPGYMKNPFIVNNINLTSIDSKYDCDSKVARNFTSYYSMRYLVDNRLTPESSVFANSIHEKRYKIFINEKDVVFTIS